MQPLIPGVIKLDPAGAYITGMTDVSNSTLHGHLRTLIEGLISDGVWLKLKYLGVAQNLEADTKRCLVRRSTAFASVTTPTHPTLHMTHIADAGYRNTTGGGSGGLTSGYTPDPADTAIRDAFGLFSFFTGAIGADIFGGRSGANAALATRMMRTSSAIDALNPGVNIVAAFAGTEHFYYWGRDNASTARAHRGTASATAASTRTGTWGWNSTEWPDSTIHHYGWNYQNINNATFKAIGDTICAWGMTDGTLDTTQVNALRTRLTTYLTARGAI